ncbi:hypothetical protein HAX54_051487, partial [Datura stramonium]|nr:hypothetical protein [Datura stramonium]
AAFDVFKASKLPAHYKELEAIIVIKPHMSDAALDYFLSCKYPLEVALVNGEELIGDAVNKECPHIQ